MKNSYHFPFIFMVSLLFVGCSKPKPIEIDGLEITKHHPHELLEIDFFDILNDTLEECYLEISASLSGVEDLLRSENIKTGTIALWWEIPIHKDSSIILVNDKEIFNIPKSHKKKATIFNGRNALRYSQIPLESGNYTSIIKLEILSRTGNVIYSLEGNYNFKMPQVYNIELAIQKLDINYFGKQTFWKTTSDFFSTSDEYINIQKVPLRAYEANPALSIYEYKPIKNKTIDIQQVNEEIPSFAITENEKINLSIYDEDPKGVFFSFDVNKDDLIEDFSFDLRKFWADSLNVDDLLLLERKHQEGEEVQVNTLLLELNITKNN